MAMLAMGDPKLASMDPKMLQALGLGLDPKLLGMGGLPQTQDQKMLAALGMAGLGDPKTAQAQAQAMQAQAMQLQQQLAMSMGMGGLDAKTLSALGMPGLDAASLAALTGMGGIDMKQMQLQQQQQEAQTKALAQLMGGSIDPKLLGLGAGAAIPGLAGLDDATKRALGLPVGTPRPEERVKSETPTPTETPKPPETETEKPAEDKPSENGEAPKPEENGETKENAEGEIEGGEENKEEKKRERYIRKQQQAWERNAQVWDIRCMREPYHGEGTEKCECMRCRPQAAAMGMSSVPEEDREAAPRWRTPQRRREEWKGTTHSYAVHMCTRITFPLETHTVGCSRRCGGGARA